MGCVSCPNYTDDYAFLGYYIVSKEHRNKGFGLRLFQAATKRAEREGPCNIGLDGVVEQISNYEKSGFKQHFMNRRYSGSGTSPAHPTTSSSSTAVRIIPLDLSPQGINELIEYEVVSRVHPCPRPQLLTAWFKESGHRLL